MPHVIVKLRPGKSEHQKRRLADALSADVQRLLGDGAESVSVALEEVAPRDWDRLVHEPLIAGRREQLFKRPGYGRLGTKRS